MRDPFTLNAAERMSPLWLRLCAYLDQRIEDLRTQNEGDRTIEQTSKLRGQIAEARSIRKLGADPVNALPTIDPIG